MVRGSYDNPILVSATKAMAGPFRGAMRVLKKAPTWKPEHKAYLISAMSNRQWTQTLRAKPPEFSGDAVCQLCLAQPGTEEHRFCFDSTRPEKGWPRMEGDEAQLAEGLSADRARILKLKATLVVAVPAPQVQEERGWQWITDPPNMAVPH